MMQAVQLLVLCTLSYIGAIDIFIESPALLLDCRSHGGSHMVESTSRHGYPQMVESTTSLGDSQMVESTASVVTVAPVSPEELYYAAGDGDLSFINTAISQLSSNGLDLNWRNADYRGETALHIATETNQPSIVAALLDAGADPDVQTQDGQAPMHIAAWKNHIRVLRLLLDHKYQADVNLQGISGWTPVYAAADRGHTAALELLLAHGGDPNNVGNDGYSPLITASYWGHVEAVRMLIQAGAHVDYVSPNDGRTALHVAARFDWEGVAHQADIALQLLQNGADKNKQDNDGKTAADWARVRGYDSVAQLIDNY